MKLAKLIAQGIDVTETGLNETALNAGYDKAGSLTATIGSIIQTALGFVGFVVFAFILFAGFQWMTAGGNEEQVAKAKTMIKNAIIGFVIITAAYAIVYFVTAELMNTTGA